LAYKNVVPFSGPPCTPQYGEMCKKANSLALQERFRRELTISLNKSIERRRWPKRYK